MKRMEESVDDDSEFKNPKATVLITRLDLMYHGKHIDANKIFRSATAKDKKHRLRRNRNGRDLDLVARANFGKPLTAMRRTEDAPLGQKVGTITSTLAEMDKLLQHTWEPIFKGNSSNHNNLTDDFCGTYKDCIYKRENTFELEPLTGDDLRFTCRHASRSAKGLDNYEPAELAFLSVKTFDVIAKLLNLVEECYPWPTSMTQAKGFALCKLPEPSSDPLDHRILLITAAFDRRYMTTRLRHCAP